MQICQGCTFGKSGRASREPERLVKSDGIHTLVMKLRSVHLLPGRNLTRFDFFGPPAEPWRTILRFLEKGFGTAANHISRGGSNQTARPQPPNRNRRRADQSSFGSGGGRQTKIP